MKKLFSFVTLVILTLSIFFASCTEEVVKVIPPDQNGKGQHNDF